jgi:2-polyprenyl-3-methyl-5-hydroxy-6-metoxy-1,4-benzoquinol methylase
MAEHLLTERQRRERAYYDQFSRRGPASSQSYEISFDPVLGREERPWNSYWFVYELAMRHFRSADQRLLDFGCGPGDSSLRYARIGYEVSAFDISPNNIATAEAAAKKYGLEHRTQFAVGVAEALDHPSEHFDVVVGIDILHHVEIPRALAECWRVLKKGGVAIFHEPVRVPFFDAVRETRLGRWLVPQEASLDLHITHDERKLTAEDLATMRRFDPEPMMRRFLVASRFDRFLQSSRRFGPPFLEKADHRLLQTFPFLGPLGGVIVVQLRK